MRYSTIYKPLFIFISCIIPNIIWAAGNKQVNPIWTWVLENILIIIAGLVVLGALIALWQLMNAVIIQKSREFYRAHGVEVPPAPPSQEGTFLSRWYKKVVGLIPIEQESDIVLNHDYDGIRELDNSLPPWWLYGFYFTILISVGYLYVYHFSDIGLNQQEEYELEMKIGERQKAYFASLQANNINEDELLYLDDERSLQFGKDAFIRNCAACHGQEGQGGVGPNLTDLYWLHGGSLSHIYKSIKNGIPEKGMIAWKSQMQPVAMHKIACYIQSIQGTNPRNPKEKQGILYEVLLDTASINK